MGRKNNRADIYEPLDLTPPLHASRRPGEGQWERIARQRNARINGGIDWSACLVPGCGDRPHGDSAARDHMAALPLCLNHLGVAWVHAGRAADKDHPAMVDAVAQVVERREARAEAEAEATRKTNLARTDGHIYALRLNGLIKVGWSRDVDQRINSYGPDAQVLCIYEGTRDDETLLHRQLRPARARGREWYEDGLILADFVAKAVAQHGEPRWVDHWSRPTKPAARPRRSSRR